MHQMTELSQAEELNIIDAMTVIESTVDLLKRIKDDEDTINKGMDAGIEFLQKLGVAGPMEEYRRKHRMCRVPVRLDENQATGVPMSFHQYYRSDFKEFLNVLIVQYGENLTRCFETLKPLMVVFKPPLTESSIDDIIDLVRLFPSNLSIDPHILHSGVFQLRFPRKSSQKNIQYSRRRSKLYRRAENGFPSYKSMLPFIDDNTSNCGEGRAYIQSAEIVKTPLRTTMGDQRLESLLLMSCENDFTDSIDFECVARDWADLKDEENIFCPGTITHAESINSDLQRGLDRRLRRIQHRTQNITRRTRRINCPKS